MRVLQTLKDTVNIYLASKAIFYLLKKESRLKTVTIRGLGTGFGKVPSITSYFKTRTDNK